MKRFILTMSQKSAKGVVDQAVGKVSEALQCRKAEQPIDRAGNDDRRPERYPARGIKGTANKQCDLRDDTRQKADIVGPSRREVGVSLEWSSGSDRIVSWRRTPQNAWRFTHSSTRRTAVCGPACTAVWEGATVPLSRFEGDHRARLPRKTAAESVARRHELYCGCGCEGVCGGGDCGLWPPNPWLPPNELCPKPPCPGIPPGIPGVPGVTAPGIPAVTPPVGFTGPVSKPPRSAMGR